MKVSMKVGLAAAALTVALSSGFFVGQATAFQGHMWRALHALQNARQQLGEAERNKAGHRWAALQATDEAIRETRAGIDAGEEW